MVYYFFLNFGKFLRFFVVFWKEKVFVKFEFCVWLVVFFWYGFVGVGDKLWLFLLKKVLWLIFVLYKYSVLIFFIMLKKCKRNLLYLFR